MNSEKEYKGKPIRGILILVVIAVTFSVLISNHDKESEIIYFFKASAYKFSSNAFSKIQETKKAPHIYLTWKSTPSITPTDTPTALFKPSITPTTSPLTEKMLVEVKVNGNTANFQVTLVDDDSIPIAGANGYIELNSVKYNLPPTNANGITNITLTVTPGENLIVYEEANGLSVSDSLYISQ